MTKAPPPPQSTLIPRFAAHNESLKYISPHDDGLAPEAPICPCGWRGFSPHPHNLPIEVDDVVALHERLDEIGNEPRGMDASGTDEEKRERIRVAVAEDLAKTS